MSGPLVRPAPRRGVYEDPFWAFVGTRVLHLQQCSQCGHWWYPPGPACPACLSRSWYWQPVQGGGDVLSWTTFHQPYFPTIALPHHVVAAALDEGPILLADLDGDAAHLALGARVRLTYRDARDEEGNAFTLHGWALDASSSTSTDHPAHPDHPDHPDQPDPAHRPGAAS